MKDLPLSQNVKGLSFGYVQSNIDFVFGLGTNKSLGIYKSFDGTGIVGITADFNIVVYSLFLGLSTKLASNFSQTNAIFQPSFGFNSLYFMERNKFFDTFFFSISIGRNIFINDSFKSHFNFWNPTFLFGINLKKIDR
ncbi:MAG: hypothetical protein AAGC85_20930 [Bacteroidota bacterium]